MSQGNYQNPSDEQLRKLFEGHTWADEGAPPPESIQGDEDSPHRVLVKAIKRACHGYDEPAQLAAFASVLLEMTDYHPDPSAYNGGLVQAQAAFQFGQNLLFGQYHPPQHLLFCVGYLCWIRKQLIESGR
jgi:hypothetical protein